MYYLLIAKERYGQWDFQRKLPLMALPRGPRMIKYVGLEPRPALHAPDEAAEGWDVPEPAGCRGSSRPRLLCLQKQPQLSLRGHLFLAASEEQGPPSAGPARHTGRQSHLCSTRTRSLFSFSVRLLQLLPGEETERWSALEGRTSGV